MSAGVMIGFVTAYPVNWWLVAKGLKHGMGTQRALGKGGHSLAAEKARLRAIAEGNGARPEAAAAAHGMAHSGAK